MDNLFGRKAKTKLSNVDPETGTKTFDVEYLPDFDSLLDNVNDATDIAKNIVFSQDIKSSEEFNNIYEHILNARNNLRNYLRKYYSQDYEKLKVKLKETMKKSELRQIIKEEIASMSAGVGEQYATKDIIDEDEKKNRLNNIRNAYYIIGDNIDGLIDNIEQLPYDFPGLVSKEKEDMIINIRKELNNWKRVSDIVKSSKIGKYL